MSSQKEHNIVATMKQLLIAVAGLPQSDAAAAAQRAAQELRDQLGAVGYDIR